jgi:hypothetical protein
VKKFEVFESVESCIIGSNPEECSMFSAICDDDGYFTLSGEGHCGIEGLEKIVCELEEIIRTEKENEK